MPVYLALCPGQKTHSLQGMLWEYRGFGFEMNMRGSGISTVSSRCMQSMVFLKNIVRMLILTHHDGVKVGVDRTALLSVFFNTGASGVVFGATVVACGNGTVSPR